MNDTCRTIQQKMFRPLLLAWAKQWHSDPGYRINSLRLDVFVQTTVVSLNCCDEVLSAEYHNIRASQGMKVS